MVEYCNSVVCYRVDVKEYSNITRLIIIIIVYATSLRWTNLYISSNKDMVMTHDFHVVDVF